MRVESAVAVALCVAAGACAGAEGLGAGLIAHWSFDADDPKIASDTVSGLTGRLRAVSRVGAAGQKALRFGGAGAVDVAHATDGRLDFGTTRDLTLSLWVHIAQPPREQYGLLGKGDRGSNPKLLLKVLRTGRVLLRMGDGSSYVDLNGSTLVADGKWRHIAAVADRDGGSRLYVDGKLDGQAGPTDKIRFDSGSPLVMGKSHQKGASARRFLMGHLDDVRIYGRALTDAEIAQLSRERGPRPAVESLSVPPDPERRFVQPHLRASADEITRTIANGQGEMAGEVTQTTAIVQSRLTWGRKLLYGDLPGCPGVARFEVARSSDMVRARYTEWLRAEPEHDFIVKTQLTGLEPGTRYCYRITYGPNPQQTKTGLVCTFKTLPGPAAEDTVRFVVVTGMNYNLFHHGRRGPDTAYQGADKALGYPALEAIRKLDPDFLVGTGDNVYYDNPARSAAKTQAELRRKWHGQFIQPRFISLFARVPTYWEKDDHDHRYNDCDTTGSREPSNELGIATFLEQVPVVDPKASAPCTYRTHRVTRQLQVWLVEGRDYRSPNRMPDGPGKTVWGREQLAWLKRTLLASDAAFKILISPTPMIGPDRSSKTDNHANPRGFMHEGRAFFRWLTDNGFLHKGFYLVCGDRHWQYHSIDPSGFEEFSTGALVDANAIRGTFPGDPKSNDPDGRIQQPFHPKAASGGFLLIAVAGGATPSATFAFYDEKGELLYEHTKRSK